MHWYDITYSNTSPQRLQNFTPLEQQMNRWEKPPTTAVRLSYLTLPRSTSRVCQSELKYQIAYLYLGSCVRARAHVCVCACMCACTCDDLCICTHSFMSSSFATLWPVACQAPLSMGFLRQEYRNGLPFPSPGDLPDPGIKPISPALPGGSLPMSQLGSPVLNH